MSDIDNKKAVHREKERLRKRAYRRRCAAQRKKRNRSRKEVANKKKYNDTYRAKCLKSQRLRERDRKSARRRVQRHRRERTAQAAFARQPDGYKEMHAILCMCGNRNYCTISNKQYD